MVVSIDDVKELQKELNNDYIINHELSSLAGGLALRFGRFLALANTALITAKHITKTKRQNPRDGIIFKSYIYTHHKHKHCTSFSGLGLFDLYVA